jgi:hypothetical protein
MVIAEDGKYVLSLREMNMAVSEEFLPFSAGVIGERRGTLVMLESWRDGEVATYPERLVELDGVSLVVSLGLASAHFGERADGRAKLSKIFGADRRIEYTVLMTLESCNGKGADLVRRVTVLLMGSGLFFLVDCNEIRGILVKSTDEMAIRKILSADNDIRPLLLGGVPLTK